MKKRPSHGGRFVQVIPLSRFTSVELIPIGPVCSGLLGQPFERGRLDRFYYIWSLSPVLVRQLLGVITLHPSVLILVAVVALLLILVLVFVVTNFSS